MKCYNGIISMRLRIILCALIYTNKHFWCRCRGTVAELTSSLALSCTILLSFYLFFPFYHGSRIHPYLPIWCTHGHKPIATRIFKVYPNTWLWAAPAVNQHGLGSTLFRRRWWKPLFSLKWVWADLCMSTHCGHVRWNLMMEALSLFFDGKSLMLVQSHH